MNIKTLKHNLSLLFLIFNIFHIYGQLGEGNISGHIKDENGIALEYCNISLLNSNLGTTSNSLGYFELNQSSYSDGLDTLIISFIGYSLVKVPIDFTKPNDQHLKITLVASDEDLKEITLFSKKINAKKIVRKAIHNIEDNYSNEILNLEGFYREVGFEDEKCVELNESVFNLTYSQYPQKVQPKKGSDVYWSSVSLKSNNSIFSHELYFPYYISFEDSVRIKESRISQNNSYSNVDISPKGGQFSMIALDKVKYQYDFLDPKVIKKYKYKYAETRYINGVQCYVINYKPIINKKNRPVVNRTDSKMKKPLYEGSLFISYSDFSIVKIEGKLSNQIIFGNYFKKYIPDNTSFVVEYSRVNSKWYLCKVTLIQEKNKYFEGREFNYKCERTMSLTPIERVADSIEIQKMTHDFILRDNCKMYDEKFWKGFENQILYTPLKNKYYAQLEKFGLLEKQFNLINLSIDSIEIPKVSKPKTDFTSNKGIISDEYEWLENGKNDSNVYNYLMSENRYFHSVNKKMDYNNNLKFSTQYSLNFDTEKREKEIELRSNYLKTEIDSNSGNVQLFWVNNENKKMILDITLAKDQKTNFNIETIRWNEANKVAYTYSEYGDISYTLIVKPFGVDNTIDSICFVHDFYWLTDSTLLYIKDDSVTFRSSQLMVHKLGSSVDDDQILFKERDNTFDLEFEHTDSKDSYFLVNSSVDSTIYYQINEDSLKLIPILNDDGILKKVYKFKDQLYKIVTKNKLNQIFVKSKKDDSNWSLIYKTILPILDIFETKTFIGIKEFKTNTPILKILNKNTRKYKQLHLPEYYCSFYFTNDSVDYQLDKLTLSYSSPKTVYQTYQIDLKTGILTLLEDEKLSKWVNKNDLIVELIWVQSENKYKIPITLFYNKKMLTSQPRGLVVKSYGAYGSIQSPYFNAENLMYANDSLVVAYIHTRGGGELGDEMYKSGKLHNKVNSFKDFIEGTMIIQKKFNISNKRTIACGTSAGGLIMGYMANNYPSMFGGLVFDKPYLDVLNTMLDTILPLTTMEYLEWGNPYKYEDFEYIKTYSPYQNISNSKFPNMMFFSKYYDVQTPYWQILKSVAKYRENNIGNGIILLNTDLNSGHRGSIENSSIGDLVSKYNFVNYVIESSQK